jgi:membrane associated rhomboid family serine protease
VGGILVAMLLASVLAWTSGPRLGATLALWPSRLLEGEIWRLVTWVFFQPHPLTLLFVGLTLWWLGRELAAEWSEGTFLLRFLGIAAGSGLVTTVAGLLWEAADFPYAGGWPVTVALLAAWGLLHPGAQLSFFGVVPMNGKLVAQLVVFGAILFALFEGFGRMVPHFAAIAIAWLQVTGRLGGRRLWLRTRQRWLEWKLARRRRHLRPVGRNGEQDPPRWMH